MTLGVGLVDMIVGTSACVWAHTRACVCGCTHACARVCMHMCMGVHNHFIGEDVWCESLIFLDWMFLFGNAGFIAVGS